VILFKQAIPSFADAVFAQLAKLAKNTNVRLHNHSITQSWQLYIPDRGDGKMDLCVLTTVINIFL
jgi:hypothetical protein